MATVHPGGDENISREPSQFHATYRVTPFPPPDPVTVTFTFEGIYRTFRHVDLHALEREKRRWINSHRDSQYRGFRTFICDIWEALTDSEEGYVQTGYLWKVISCDRGHLGDYYEVAGLIRHLAALLIQSPTHKRAVSITTRFRFPKSHVPPHKGAIDSALNGREMGYGYSSDVDGLIHKILSATPDTQKEVMETLLDRSHFIIEPDTDHAIHFAHRHFERLNGVDVVFLGDRRENLFDIALKVDELYPTSLQASLIDQVLKATDLAELKTAVRLMLGEMKIHDFLL
jgi:hypothetical protein